MVKTWNYYVSDVNLSVLIKLSKIDASNIKKILINVIYECLDG